MCVMLLCFRMLLLSNFGNSVEQYNTAMKLPRREGTLVKLHNVLLGMVEPLASYRAVFAHT